MQWLDNLCTVYLIRSTDLVSKITSIIKMSESSRIRRDQPVGFLDLPGELRNRIYDLVFERLDSQGGYEESKEMEKGFEKQSEGILEEDDDSYHPTFPRIVDTFPDWWEWLSYLACNLAATHPQILSEMFSLAEKRKINLLVIPINVLWDDIYALQRSGCLCVHQLTPRDRAHFEGIGRAISLLSPEQQHHLLTWPALNLRISLLLGEPPTMNVEDLPEISSYICLIAKVLPRLQRFEIHGFVDGAGLVYNGRICNILSQTLAHLTGLVWCCREYFAYGRTFLECWTQGEQVEAIERMKGCKQESGSPTRWLDGRNDKSVHDRNCGSKGSTWETVNRNGNSYEIPALAQRMPLRDDQRFSDVLSLRLPRRVHSFPSARKKEPTEAVSQIQV